MSTTLTLRIPDDLHSQLKDETKVRPDLTVSDLARDYLQRGISSPPVFDLAAAAELFLRQLEPEHRQAIEEASREKRRTPAEFILAYIIKARDSGDTYHPLPEFSAPKEELSQLKPVPAVKHCDWCHQPYKPMKADQRFCPPEEETGKNCGREASLAEIRAKRSKRAPGGMADAIPPTMTRILHV